MLRKEEGNDSVPFINHVIRHKYRQGYTISQNSIEISVQKITFFNALHIYLCFMLKLIFELFIIYLLYKLVFEFIIPVYRTTKQMSQKMSEMQQKMQQEQHQYQPTEKSKTVEKPISTNKDDYIDYEEIK